MAACELVFDIGGATQKLGLLWPFSLQPAPGSTWFKEQEAGAEATIGPACAPPLRAAQKRSPGLPQPSEAPVCLGKKKMAEYLRLPSSLALIRLCNPPVNALRYHRRDGGCGGSGWGLVSWEDWPMSSWFLPSFCPLLIRLVLAGQEPTEAKLVL